MHARTCLTAKLPVQVPDRQSAAAVVGLAGLKAHSLPDRLCLSPAQQPAVLLQEDCPCDSAVLVWAGDVPPPSLLEPPT